jgi:dTDP-4-amino-4,6-dideoxygalactose transaminase
MKYSPTVKTALKIAARQTIGRLPAPRARLGGKLAKYGGVPVRDTRFRPWASVEDDNPSRWRTDVRRMFRRIFVDGVEGLPQPLAEQFAQEWAAYCGCRYALMLSHGTDALRIGLAAALDQDGLDYGGEVIVPNFSFIASATAALDRRLGVAFVDVEPGTLLLDSVRVEEAIVPGKTRAIVPVHLFGQPADMTALNRVAEKHGLKVIEDAAQAHGAVWEARSVGSLGSAAGFSFQSSKNLACGEGGALTTNDEELFERAYAMHNVGRSRIGPARWEHSSLGWNCRITEYQAALLLYRLKDFDRLQKRRQVNFQLLRDLMQNVSCLTPLTQHPNVHAHGMYMFAMRFKRESVGFPSVEVFLDLVQAEGAPIYRAFSATISQQPGILALAQRHPEYFRRLPTPVSDQAASDTLFIPQNIFLGTSRDMEDIAAAMMKVERGCRTDMRKIRSDAATNGLL